MLAWDTIRYQGEPVALVAADHPETARRALEKIRVEYEVAGREYGVALPVTTIVDQMLLSRRQMGWSDEGHSALLRIIEDLSEHEIGQNGVRAVASASASRRGQYSLVAHAEEFHGSRYVFRTS